MFVKILSIKELVTDKRIGRVFVGTYAANKIPQVTNSYM